MTVSWRDLLRGTAFGADPWPRLRKLRFMPAVVLLVVTAVGCVAGLAGPAMAAAMDQDCPDPGCAERIGCGQPTSLIPAPPGSSLHLVALPTVVERGVRLGKTGTRSGAPPPLTIAGHAFGLLAPRSPPAA